MSKSLVKQALELCSDEHQRIKKHKGNVSKLKSSVKSVKKQKLNQSLVEKYCIEKNKNNMEKNLEMLKKLSKPVIKYETIRSAILDKKNLPTNAKKEMPNKKEDESFFTEQEFKDFEKSYFNKK